MEAKASAGIIGALPFIVGGLVYLTSPELHHAAVHRPAPATSILGARGIWMSIGIFVMRKMINFDV